MVSVIVFFLVFAESMTPILNSSSTDSSVTPSTITSKKTANYCKSNEDCRQPVESYCYKGICRCKIFHTEQPQEANANISMSTTNMTISTNMTILRICVPISCSRTEDCGLGQGAEDYSNDLLTCVSSGCQCKSPLVLVNDETQCGDPTWLLIFKIGGYISLGAIIIGTLACCCNWLGILQLCTGGTARAANDVLTRNSSSMISIKSAVIDGRRPAPPPSLLGSPLTPSHEEKSSSQPHLIKKNEIDLMNKSDSK